VIICSLHKQKFSQGVITFLDSTCKKKQVVMQRRKRVRLPESQTWNGVHPDLLSMMLHA
jgi:hypothetical protein